MADPFTMMAIAGTAIAAGGSVLGGIATNNAKKAEAESMEIAAGQARAGSQRMAGVKDREAELLRSRQLAVAAKGGAAGDQQILDLMADTAERGQLNVANTLWEGEDRARGLRDQADATRLAGKQAVIGGVIDAAATVLSAGGKLGMGGAGGGAGAGASADASAASTVTPTRYGPMGSGSSVSSADAFSPATPPTPKPPGVARYDARMNLVSGFIDPGSTLLSGATGWGSKKRNPLGGFSPAGVAPNVAYEWQIPTF